MSSILDELKYKYPDTEDVQKANNIAECVAAMPTGGSGGVMVVNLSNETTLDKTWQEIYDAVNRGEFCFVRSAGSTGITLIYISEVGSDTTYYVSTTDDSTYVSATSDGYPSFDNES